jgi:hypothetical protein
MTQRVEVQPTVTRCPTCGLHDDPAGIGRLSLAIFNLVDLLDRDDPKSKRAVADAVGELLPFMACALALVGEGIVPGGPSTGRDTPGGDAGNSVG